MECVGYGEYENKCENKAGGVVRPRVDRGKRSRGYFKYWCDRCEKLRRATITQQLESILKSFKSDGKA